MCRQHVSREGYITEKDNPCCQWPYGHTEERGALESGTWVPSEVTAGPTGSRSQLPVSNLHLSHKCDHS